MREVGPGASGTNTGREYDISHICVSRWRWRNESTSRMLTTSITASRLKTTRRDCPLLWIMRASSGGDDMIRDAHETGFKKRKRKRGNKQQFAVYVLRQSNHGTFASLIFWRDKVRLRSHFARDRKGLLQRCSVPVYCLWPDTELWASEVS